MTPFLHKLYFLLLGVLCTIVLYFALRDPGVYARGIRYLTHRKAAPAEQQSGIPTPFGRILLKTGHAPSGIAIHASCIDCRYRNSRLAPAALRSSSAFIEGTFKHNRFDGRINFEGIQGELSTTWKLNAATGSFVLPETPIADIYHALRSIVPEAAQAKVSGVISAAGTFEWPELFLVFKPQIKDFAVAGLVDEQRYRHGEFAYPGKDASGKPQKIISGEGTPSWMPLRTLGSLLAQAVMAAEDGAFYHHPGYDLGNITEAMEQNKTKRGLFRGASTLSQQLAKNLFLDNDRSYARKLRELLYAVELDRELGKGRVLELYLNIVEWGPGIYGAKNAAAAYFAKDPAELSLVEAAWLASILRSPRKAWNTQYLKRQVRRRQLDTVLRRMQAKGTITGEQLAEALSVELEFAQASRALAAPSR